MKKQKINLQGVVTSWFNLIKWAQLYQSVINWTFYNDTTLAKYNHFFPRFIHEENGPLRLKDCDFFISNVFNFFKNLK